MFKTPRCEGRAQGPRRLQWPGAVTSLVPITQPWRPFIRLRSRGKTLCFELCSAPSAAYYYLRLGHTALEVATPQGLAWLESTVLGGAQRLSDARISNRKETTRCVLLDMLDGSFGCNLLVATCAGSDDVFDFENVVTKIAKPSGIISFDAFINVQIPLFPPCRHQYRSFLRKSMILRHQPMYDVRVECLQ